MNRQTFTDLVKQGHEYTTITIPMAEPLCPLYVRGPLAGQLVEMPWATANYTVREYEWLRPMDHMTIHRYVRAACIPTSSDTLTDPTGIFPGRENTPIPRGVGSIYDDRVNDEYYVFANALPCAASKGNKFEPPHPSYIAGDAQWIAGVNEYLEEPNEERDKARAALMEP